MHDSKSPVLDAKTRMDVNLQFTSQQQNGSSSRHTSANKMAKERKN